MNLITKGNTKVKALLFDLPTNICAVQCPKCYARKAEVRFPNVLAKRNENYYNTFRDLFCTLIIDEIKKSKCKIVRIHSSGDFYSQEYIHKWIYIARALPDRQFYAYTKTKTIFDFNEFEELENVNIIDSTTELGVNYGNREYCEKLMELGYILCPCEKNVHVACMVDCKICLTEKQICFIEH